MLVLNGEVVRCKDVLIDGAQMCELANVNFNDWKVLFTNTLFDGEYPENICVPDKTWLNMPRTLHLAKWISTEFYTVVLAYEKLHWFKYSMTKVSYLFYMKYPRLKNQVNEPCELLQHVNDITQHKPDGYIYLATCSQYASSNLYKLGRTENLNSRLSAYQVGRTTADQMYYVYTYKTAKVAVLETMLRKLLEEYRQDASKDIYKMSLPMLQEFVASTCVTFANIIIQKNTLIRKINATFAPVVIPQTITFNDSIAKLYFGINSICFTNITQHIDTIFNSKLENEIDHFKKIYSKYNSLHKLIQYIIYKYFSNWKYPENRILFYNESDTNLYGIFTSSLQKELKIVNYEQDVQPNVHYIIAKYFTKIIQHNTNNDNKELYDKIKNYNFTKNTGCIKCMVDIYMSYKPNDPNDPNDYECVLRNCLDNLYNDTDD